MTKKFLYLVNFWACFPTSEYGGLLAVVGENDNEIHKILLEWRDDYLEKYDYMIMKEVVKSQKFALAEDVNSGVVEAFTT